MVFCWFSLFFSPSFLYFLLLSLLFGYRIGHNYRLGHAYDPDDDGDDNPYGVRVNETTSVVYFVPGKGEEEPFLTIYLFCTQRIGQRKWEVAPQLTNATTGTITWCLVGK